MILDLDGDLIIHTKYLLANVIGTWVHNTILL